MKDTDKVTLTIGQIKRLIKESKITEAFDKNAYGLFEYGDNVLQSAMDELYDDMQKDGVRYKDEAFRFCKAKIWAVIKRLCDKDGLDYEKMRDNLVAEYGEANRANEFVPNGIIQFFKDEIYWEGSDWLDGDVWESKLTEAEELTESGDGNWYVQCDPTFFHENHCETQKKIYDFMKKFNGDIPESAHITLVKLAKSLGADGCIGFTDSPDGVTWFLIFEDEESAINFANILYDDGSSWPEDYVTDQID